MKDSKKIKTLAHLQSRDWEDLCAWTEEDRGVVRIVTSLLLHDNKLIRWRAVEALGKICGWKAKHRQTEQVRSILRRMLWNMNDESGGLIRNAPEAITEILLNVPKLIEKFGPVLVSHIDVDPFPAGVYRGIAYLSAVKPEPFLETEPLLLPALQSDDPRIRAYAAQSLGQLGVKSARQKIAPLLEDSTEFEDYDLETGQIVTRKVCDMAKEGFSVL